MTAADWSSTNIQLLRGDDFIIPGVADNVEKDIVTLEHASGWKYGDNFFFVDITNGEGTDTEFYGEFSPRLSFGKMADWKPEGFVKDVLLAAQWNVGKDDAGNVSAYLLGVGFDLAVPKAAFFQFNVYQRAEHNDQVFGKTDDSTWQLNIAGLFPFDIGNTSWSIGGFADYIGEIDGPFGTNEAHLLFVPQILLDVGALAGAPGMIQAGIEYSYWKNKFGVDGENERVVQLMLKWTL
ncbi:DUF5020 domain-containing protein [Permianibacter sp. IMCC34836]|uniref:outer membrane protein OmpK n=1 Tax=Permianibacter fluminis TaxID=2738515 RepID=UPI001551EC30|nr:outer membrane protein OmpK [Permianibacter fluminis]NQD38827.1 DUF5020 domain-containing protein [Permianibacter fluminis]